MGQCFHQNGNCFQKFFTKETSWHVLPSSQFVMTVKITDGQCIPPVDRIMNSENTPRENTKCFVDLVNMVKRADG